MGSHLKTIRRLVSLFSLLPVPRFLRSGAGMTESDFLHLLDLRRDIERLERPAMARISCRPLQYSGPQRISGDPPGSSESFLPGCMIQAKKEIDDILRVETREES